MYKYVHMYTHVTLSVQRKHLIDCKLRLQLIMELENCNAHGEQENTGPNTPQHDNDPSGNKKWYRQASQRLVNASFITCVHLSLYRHKFEAFEIALEIAFS